VRFCHVTTFYPPYNFGGDGIAVQRLSEALVRRGHEVTVIHAVEAFNSLHKGAVPTPPGPAAVRTIALDSRLGRISPLLTHQLGRPVVHSRRLSRLLAEGEYDVINFHNVSLIGGPAILAFGNAVKLYTAHEHWLVCPTHVLWRHDREPCDEQQCLRCVLIHRRPPQLWRSTSMLDRSLRHIDMFIALSEFSRRKHAEFGFTRPMEVLPCFTSVPDAASSAKAPRDRPYVLYVGRLERLKGLDDVLPVFDRELGVDLLVAGNGTHETALRKVASGKSVRFMGWLDRDALAAYYRDALAVLVPTVGYETFGQAVIEAFSHGVPVIARRTGPLPELVEGSGAGELFHEPHELREVVVRLLEDPDLRRGYGVRAQEAFRAHFCEDVVVPRYLDLVRRAAARRGRRDVVATLERGERPMEDPA
jgi:glycosyltransferase involved in cell wall biosynthesis